MTENLTHTVIIILYLILFFPVIVLNIIDILLLALLPTFIIGLAFLPKKFNDFIKSNNVTIKNVSGNVGFKGGQLIRFIQEDITDGFPLFLPKKTIITPLQRIILNKFISLHEIIIESSIKGFFSGVKAGNSTTDNSTGPRKFKMGISIAGLIKLLALLLISVFGFLLMITPTVLLILLIILFN